MYVKDHMTANPITITADTPLSKALEIMGKNHFHRLPVVDANHKLIGLIRGTSKRYIWKERNFLIHL